MNVTGVIIAGGRGERFWPKSRTIFPIFKTKAYFEKLDFATAQTFGHYRTDTWSNELKERA